MKRGEIYSGGFLKASDLIDKGQADGIDVTIKAVHTDTMDDGKQQRILSFHETDQQLGLNVTNWDSIAVIAGVDDDDHWVGLKIRVYPHRLDRPYNGKTHGIRVRAVVGGGGLPANAIPHATAQAAPASGPKVTAWKEYGAKTPALQDKAAGFKKFVADVLQGQTPTNDVHWNVVLEAVRGSVADDGNFIPF